MPGLDIEKLEDKLAELFTAESNRIVDAVARAQANLLIAVAVLLKDVPGFDKKRFFKKFDMKLEEVYSE